MLIGPAGGATGGAAGTVTGWGRTAVGARGKGPEFGTGAAGPGARPRMCAACVWVMTAAAFAALPCVTALVAPAASAAAIAGLRVGDCARAKQFVSGRHALRFSASSMQPNICAKPSRSELTELPAMRPIVSPLGLPTRHVLLADMNTARLMPGQAAGLLT